MTALLPSVQALAQCAPASPAAVSISSGSCEDPAFTERESAGTVVAVSGTGSYSATSTHLLVTGSGYGAHATGGGTIALTGTPGSGTTLSEITTYGAGSHGLYADGGGLITGDNTAIYTNDAGAYGIGAVGTGSRVTLTDGAANISGDGSYGAYAASGGAITLTRTDIQTYGAGASAVFVDTGGSVILNNLNTFSMGASNASGAVASGVGSSLTLNSTFVNVYSNDGAGLFATGGGLIILNGGAVVTGDYYGSTIITTAPGILARGAGSRIQVSNGATSATYGANSPGVWADAGARVDFAGYGIFTYQPNSPGVQADGGSTVTLTETVVRTSGPSSAGLLVRGGSTIIVTGTEVATGYRVTGGTPPALQFPEAEIGLEAHGVEVVGAGSLLQAENDSITTNGDGAVGIRVSQGGTALVTGGTITTGGADTAAGGADGVRATDTGSSSTLTGTSVTTRNINAVGLHAVAGGTLAATDVTVTTQGQNAHGVQAQDAGSAITLTRAVITTGGDAAVGVQAGNAGSVQATGGSVATAGLGAAGLYALSGGMIAATNVTVATQGRNAHGVQAQDAGSAVGLTRVAIATAGDAAVGVQASNAGAVQIVGGSVTTTGGAAHGIAGIEGGTLAATGTAVAVSGAGSAAIYLAGSAPSVVSVTGGSLSAAGGAIVLAEGGTGTVSIGGGTAITPAVVNGRRLLAQVTEDAVGNPANLTLNIDGIAALAGDIVIDPSTLTYNLSNSIWTGNLVLTGPGNTALATLTAAQWTGDLLADAGDTASVALAQGSLWSGLARNATNVAIDAGSAWNVTGHSNATGVVTNAGHIQFLARSDAYTTLTVGNYAGNGGRVGFNTYLGIDNSPSNLLIVNGGTATGSTSVLVANSGGPGALTTGDGIRIVQAVNGGTTAGSAFTLGQRVAAGSYEYLLFRGGSTSSDDWFLRSRLIDVDTGNPAVPSGPVIPLYRPEVALYAPIPAIGRQMGLATLGTLHERVGEEENIRDLAGSRAYANGAWARAFGERRRDRWNGTVDARATGNLIGLQAGFDILRTQPYAGGHRDHAGVYVAYTDYNAPNVSGFAIGQQQRVGRLLMSGPSVGAYWTHFGPSGWYVDAVFQANWFDVKASSDFGTALNTNGVGYTASLEAGYPIRFGAGSRWQIEPQAQIIWQSVSVDRSRDLFSSVDWDEDDAVTGRLGARLQYTGRDERTLWQPYAKVNLWHAFSGTDRVSFGSGTPIENEFGSTALEVGAGITARVNQTTSVYAHADYRWSLAGDSRGTAVQGSIGIRFNW